MNSIQLDEEMRKMDQEKDTFKWDLTLGTTLKFGS